MKTQDNKPLGPTTYPQRHLFIDIDNVVEWVPGIYQNFPKPARVETTGLECGPPGSWDARVSANWGSVLYDEGKFRNWSCCMPGISSATENCDIWWTGYSESDDGIHWRKPDLKLVEQKRWPGNNLMKLPGCVMSVVRPLPGAGFKFLAVTILTPDAPTHDMEVHSHSDPLKGYGTYLFGSDDGIHWTQITKRPMVQHGDWVCLHVDHARQRYLLYHKIGSNHGLTSRRSMIVLESKDAIHWEGYHGTHQWHEAFVTDDYDDLIAMQRGGRLAEFYCHTLHQVGTLYLAAQTLFIAGLPLRQGAGQNAFACQSHIRMAFSHDGIVWRHPRGRPVFIEAAQPGEFGAGHMITGSNILEHGDDMWLFCRGEQNNHGYGISSNFSIDPDIPWDAHERTVRVFVAKFKRDRFASLAANQTSRFDVEVGPCQGNTLTINALTRHGGAIRVAIAEQSRPVHLDPRKSDSLPGFSFDDCEPIRGDHVRATVRFRAVKVTDLPSDKFLVLRFEITAGEVFGYEWGS
jgi:hypothetical protein